MPKKKSKKTDKSLKKKKRTITFATYPVPRRVVVNPQLTERYVKPGHLAFVNGFDRRYQAQSLHWEALHPDETRPYYDEEEMKVALPQSWPQNLKLLAPEQQWSGQIRKPIHGGFTWPGHPSPMAQVRRTFINSLPGPLKRFLF